MRTLQGRKTSIINSIQVSQCKTACSTLKLLPRPPPHFQDQLKKSCICQDCTVSSQTGLSNKSTNKFEEVETSVRTSTVSLFTIYNENVCFISVCYKNSSQVQSCESQRIFCWCSAMTQRCTALAFLKHCCQHSIPPIIILTQSSMISLMPATVKINSNGTKVVYLPVGETSGICCEESEKRYPFYVCISSKFRTLCKSLKREHRAFIFVPD